MIIFISAFFGVMGSIKKGAEVASKIGRHTEQSLGKDAKLNEFIKQAHSTGSMGSKFTAASKLFANIQTMTQGLHLLNRMHAGLVNNGSESVTNLEDEQVPFLSESEARSLGNNTAQYIKINTHIGIRTKGKLKKIKNNSAFIETDTKILCDSQSDYISSGKRSQLNIKSGFNEKNFTFFLEDTYMSVKNYYELFNVKNRFEKDIKKNKGREYWGGALKTKNQFKLKNRIDYFSCHVKIHLLKITDLEYDIKMLLNESIHTKNSTTFNSPGKIPKNFQLTYPNFSNNNKINCQFLTTLNCSLKDSSKFLERCKIVKTWSRTLSPGSILEFNLTHHLGSGISINKIVDLVDIAKSDETKISQDFVEETFDTIEKTTNQTTTKTLKEQLNKLTSGKFAKSNSNILNHPSGYIFAIETVGDRRASIVNEKNDVFSGYSPTKLNFEFKTELSYVCDQENEDELLVYVKKNKDRQFNETSDFPEIFYPDREDKFHVKFDEIDFAGTGQQKWRLEYDQSIKSAGDISESILSFKNMLDKMGISYDKIIGEDGANFNFKTDPNTTDSPAEEPEK